MTLVHVVQENLPIHLSIFFDFVNAVGLRVAAHTRYRSKADIIGFWNVPLHRMASLLAALKLHKTPVFLFQNMLIDILEANSQIDTKRCGYVGKLVTRALIRNRFRPQRRGHTGVPKPNTSSIKHPPTFQYFFPPLYGLDCISSLSQQSVVRVSCVMKTPSSLFLAVLPGGDY